MRENPLLKILASEPKSPSKQTRRNLDMKPFKAKTAPGFFDV